MVLKLYISNATNLILKIFRSQVVTKLFPNSGKFGTHFYKTHRKDLLTSSFSTCNKKSKRKLVSLKESERFMVDCLVAANVPEDHAKAVAGILISSDYRGIMSHGLNRLEMYLNEIKNNLADPCAKPILLNESPAVAWVDGQHGFGVVVAQYCMDVAIKKARKVGVGLVAAKNSNHYVVPALYCLKAMEEGLIGISMSNTNPLLAPMGATHAILGTNPLSIGAPGCEDQFLLDIATTQVALGKIELAVRKNTNIPEGWALDNKGIPTTDSKKALQARNLLPLGGIEFGYKGYGLSAAVDILSGVLAGANFSTKIGVKGKPKSLGQLFVVINPCFFAPEFAARLTKFNSILRKCKMADPKQSLLIPGDMEYKRMKEVDKAGGIEYTESQLKTCEELSKKLNVKPLSFV